MKTEKIYSYSDNWSGKKKTFSSLRLAISAARNESGDSIAIYMAGFVGVYRMVNASGYSPS